MTYYGINSSSQYGSNFSSVLADSPPPLDDTVDEDDDFVFKSEGSKETRGACTTEHNDASHHYQGDGGADEFGDFEAFADFKGSENINSTSTEWFSPSNTKQNASWHANSKDQLTTGDEQATEIDDDFADFEGFRNCTSEYNEANVGESVVSSTTDTARQYEYPNATENGNVPVSNADAGEVDDFAAFSVGDINGSLEFPLCDDSIKNVHVQDESLNGDQSMTQTSSVHQQEFKSSTSKDTASCSKQSYDSDDDFGDFSTSKKIQDISAFHGDTSKTVLPSATKDCTVVKTLNRGVASAVPEDLLAMTKERGQSESEPQCFDNHELSAETEAPGAQNEKTLAGDDQDEFGHFNCSDDARHLSDDQSTDTAAFSAFAVSPDDVGEDSSRPVTLCEQTDQENSSLHSEQADSDESRLKTNAESEWEIPSETHGLPADLSLPESSSKNADDPDNFGAFGSANCVRDGEQDHIGNDTEPETNGALNCTNCTLPSGVRDVSTSEIFVQHKADISEVEQTADAPKKPEVDEEDDFGDFSSIDSTPKSFLQHKADSSDVKETTTAAAPKDSATNMDGNFGAFNTFDSQQERTKSGKSVEPKVTVTQREPGGNTDEDFGDFSTFDSKPEDLVQQKAVSSDAGETAKEVPTKSEDEDFGYFDMFNSQPEGKAASKGFEAFPAKDTNVSQAEGFSDFGAFRSEENQYNKDTSGPSRTDSSSNVFAAFPSSQSTASFTGMEKQTLQWEETSQGALPDHSIKQHPPTLAKVQDIYVVTPCNNMVMSDLGKPVVLCFTATKPLSRQQGNVNSLDVKLHQGVASQFKVWEHLKSTVVDGRLRFQWEVSLSQHKNLKALDANVQSLPPTASYVKTDVQSLPPFATGMALLEPIKGPFVPASSPNTIQDISFAQDPPFQTPLEVQGVPDLNFGLHRFPSHKSVPELKDSSSDTMSETSSLDQDFLGSGLPNLCGERKEIKSHYELDLLGLNLDSGNLSLTSAEKVKHSASEQQLPEKKAANTEKKVAVWQFGDVSIPLASQNTEVKLSEKAQALLSDLEDLAFMQSPVLMFPIKS